MYHKHGVTIYTAVDSVWRGIRGIVREPVQCDVGNEICREELCLHWLLPSKDRLETRPTAHQLRISCAHKCKFSDLLTKNITILSLDVYFFASWKQESLQLMYVQ